MLDNSNSFIIFIFIFLISALISLLLIYICEFKTFSSNVFKWKNDDKTMVSVDLETTSDSMSLEEFNNSVRDGKIYTKVIDKNLTIELDGPYEIFLPDIGGNKDVFIRDTTDNTLTIITPGKPYFSRNKTKIEAFYYGEKYEIYYKKMKN